MPVFDYNLLKEGVHEDDELALYHPFDDDDNIVDEDMEFDEDDVEDAAIVINQLQETLNELQGSDAGIQFENAPPSTELSPSPPFLETSGIPIETNSAEFSATESHIESVLVSAYSTSTRSSDNLDALGSFIAAELHSMAIDQAEIAQKLITGILREARMGRLTSTSEIRTISESEISSKV